MTKRPLNIPIIQKRLMVNISLKNTKLGVGMKVIRVEECAMGKESSTIKMEDIMKVIGKITKWTVMASSTMKEENWLMRDNGLKMNLMGEVKFITTILYLW